MKNKVRITFQLIFLGLIGYVAVRPLFDPSYLADFEKYCPFGGIASFTSKLNQGTMSCNMSEVQVMLGLGLLFGVLVFGKLFCSYVCPIGTFTEWLGKLGQKLKVRIDMPKVLDRYMRSLKYILLFATIYLTMTTSELFCKEFDPYFASVNLFDNTDIVLYFAIPAFALTILGSIFFRMFWCKYLCPLGAVSNIFLNLAVSAGLIIIFVIANLLGAGLGLIWLISAIVLAGLLNEIGFMKSFITPFPKIVRDNEKCSDCNLCDSKCHQGIKISQLVKVDHIDCNLCTDCVMSCPLKNTLTINKRKSYRHLAPIAVVVLILISLGASNNFEFTTIAERWGNFASLSNIESYTQSGVKNIKCYGSSMALKGNLENVEGIVGLDTYAKSHSVTIYYNPALITENKVKESIFTPIKMEVRKLKPGLDSLAVWDVGIYGLFDLIDFNNLFYTLKEDSGVYGFETYFGEPVEASVYFNPAETNISGIKKQIEKEEVSAKTTAGIKKIELNFNIEDEGKLKGFIKKEDYRKKIFRVYDRLFNNYITYSKDQLSVFIFPMPEAGIPSLRRYFGSLSSHLSADNAIVRLSTRFLDVPSGLIFFDPSKTSVEKIKEELVKPKLTVFVTETETRDMENPFHIKPEGYVINASEFLNSEK